MDADLSKEVLVAIKQDLKDLDQELFDAFCSDKKEKEQGETKEGEKILSILKKNDFIILLDENGEQISSVGFSKFIQKKLNSGMKTLTFIVGGPYGFSDEVKAISQQQLSLSKMTFSHEMVRLFFTEQLYRAFSILNNEPYHHQ